MRTNKTWQSFSAGTGTAITRWNYDAYRGWLKSKDDQHPIQNRLLSITLPRAANVATERVGFAGARQAIAKLLSLPNCGEIPLTLAFPKGRGSPQAGSRTFRVRALCGRTAGDSPSPFGRGLG
jgi:hypothetical protein